LELIDAEGKPKAIMEPDYAVAAEGLTKIYKGGRNRGPVTALDAVDLAVPRGALFALLGPNGAGKSTFINILAGLVVKTSGTALIWDIDIDEKPRDARAAIGIVPQELNLDAFFTPREYLDMQAGLYGMAPGETRTDDILEMVGLADVADSYARALSGGMRRRLLIAKAMVHAPPVLVLDEPTAGVDIELREQLWQNIRALNAGGVTVLLTTHYLEEAEELCDRIAIIDHGRVVACEDKKTLLGRIDSKSLLVTLESPLTAIPPALAAYAAELTEEGAVLVRYRRNSTKAGEILDAFGRAGLTITDIRSDETDLADIFLQLTRRGGADSETADDAA
jgi:ABC-2 type transport system ATP-binding protein